MNYRVKCPNPDCGAENVYSPENDLADGNPPRSTCTGCGKTFKVNWPRNPSGENTRGPMASSPAPAPTVAPRNTLTNAPAVTSQNDARVVATILERIRSELVDIVSVLDIGGTTPQQLHAELTTVLTKLTPLIPEGSRPVHTSILDTKLDKLLAQSAELVRTSKTDMRSVDANVNRWAKIVHEQLKASHSDQEQQFQALLGTSKQLCQHVATSAEKAGEMLSSSPAMQSIEERLTSTVRAAIDSSFHSDRVLRIDQVLDLFDTLDRYLKFWKKGESLNLKEQESKDVVAAVLNEIAGRMDYWADIQGLEPFPAKTTSPIRFDESWHRRLDIEPTPDRDLDGQIADVVRLGYKWKDRRLRKADVVVYKYFEPLAAVAAPSEAGNHERSSND